MKTNNQLLKACVVTILCAGLAGVARAADENQSPDQTGSGYQSSGRMMSSSDAITSCNKASHLIGMEVKNTQNERLGKITDLAVDITSGKISYAVLDGGSTFQTKFFAVPLSAFTVSANEKYLILNADKAKMAAAQGFDKNSWPGLSNPDWGANNKFWMQPSDQKKSQDEKPQGDMNSMQHEGTDSQTPMQNDDSK